MLFEELQDHEYQNGVFFFLNSESPCCPDASHKVSAKPNFADPNIVYCLMSQSIIFQSCQDLVISQVYHIIS